MTYYVGHRISFDGPKQKHQIHGPFEKPRAAYRNELKFKPVPKDRFISTSQYHVGFKTGKTGEETYYTVEGPINGTEVEAALARITRTNSTGVHPRDLIVVEMDSS